MASKSEAFSQRLSESIERRGISLYQLAKDAGVDRTLISRWRGGSRGRSIDPLLLERISDALRVNFHWLATGRGSADDEGQAGPMPNLSAAVRFARACRISEAAIQSVVERANGDDASPERWWERIKDAEWKLKR